MTEKQKEKEKSIKMTLEQWIKQLGFFAKNSIAIGEIILSYQQFLVKLNSLLKDWEKKPKGRTNKNVRKILKEIRKLMRDSDVHVLKKEPPLPPGMPIPPEVKIPPYLVPKNVGKKGAKKKVNYDKKITEIVEKIHEKGVDEIDKEKRSQN